jgi:AraC-like DNA-binding protein
MTASSTHSIELPEKDRLPLLVDVSSAVKRVDIRPQPDAPLDYSLEACSIDDIVIFDAQLSPMTVQRSRAQASQGDDHIVMTFFSAGQARFTPQDGGELSIRAGDAYMRHNTRASHHALSGGAKFIDVSIPIATIRPQITDLDGVAQRILRPGPAIELLRDYCRILVRMAEADRSAVASTIRQHVSDLAVLALGPRRDAAEQAADGGLRHARMAAIRADIEANHAQPWLSIEAMARRHDISPQHLRSLFYREGETFSDVVREVRLRHAKRMLSDTSLAERRISDIAYACGFGDLSHFNLVFRRHYGMTPSEARRKPSS